MTEAGCERIGLEELSDYAAGELPAEDATAIEEHLFSCDACAQRAGELEGIAGALRSAVRGSQIGGFLTDPVLNRLARDGVRVRSFALAPGAVVPCAVWEGDELMVLRLRGDFSAEDALTLSQRVSGREVIRVTAQGVGGLGGEIIFAVPAGWVRQLPVVEVEVRLTADRGGEEREVGSYTLAHAGVLQR